MTSTTGTWQGTSRGTPLGHRFFIFVLRAFGPRTAHVLLWFVTPWYALTAGASNRAIRSYFGRLRASGVPGRFTALRSYLEFGEALVDRAAMRAGRAGDYTFLKPGTLQPLKDAGHGIVISAHIGNWELAGQLLGHQTDLPVHVLMRDEEMEAIRRATEQGLEQRGFHIIAIKDDLSHVFAAAEALRAGGLLCLHGDRFLPGARTARRRFLGADAHFPVGPFALARSLNVPVCYAFITRTAPLTYSFSATPPLPPRTSIDGLLDAYVQALEHEVRAHPLQWFNYYDFWRDEPSSNG